jgi:hypothetical protein
MTENDFLTLVISNNYIKQIMGIWITSTKNW